MADVRTVHPNEILEAQHRTLLAIEGHIRTIKVWVIVWSLLALAGGGLALLAAIDTSST